jgi:pimeloyl-ACP methyl ester carboxylesterase
MKSCLPCDLWALTLKLGIENPIIVGISMGGQVMCDYVSKYAENSVPLITHTIHIPQMN